MNMRGHLLLSSSVHFVVNIFVYKEDAAELVISVYGVLVTMRSF